MKKILFFASALAGLFLAASCQQEMLDPAAGSEQTVTFTVEAPAALQTKAIADGKNVDELIYEVWITDNLGVLTQGAQKLYQATTELAVDPADGKNKATLTLDLVNDQKFTILFWAQVSQAAAYDTDELTAVTYAKSEYNANDESLAAFYAVAYVDDTKHVKKDGSSTNGNVSLRRPFAQLNLGTLNTSTAYTVALVDSKVNVKNVNTVFNVATSEASSYKEMTFKMAAVPTDPATLSVNGASYEYAGMNYMFAGDNVTVEYDIKTSIKGFEANVNNIVKEVPLKENFRTNIIGNLLTSKADYEIVVDAEFNAPDVPVASNGWAHVSGYNYVVNGNAGVNSLAEILAHADKTANTATKAVDGPVVTIDLNGDVYWKTEGGHGSSPLLPATSKISKVVINGNGNTFTATGAGVGSIRLANGGLLEFNEVNVVDKTVSYKESSWEFTYLEFAGKLAFNECTFNNGVQFLTEGEEAALEASFEGCRFISNEESVYAVWISDGTTTFNGCSFEGTRGLKMHEQYGSNVAEVVIDGCWFGPLSVKPGIAIGTLDSTTKVTVKNSKFSGCQVGEAGVTTYETDTDTSTFSFVFDNNEEFTDQNEMLEDAVKDAAAGATVEVPAGEYTFPASIIKEGMTLQCAEGTVFKGNSKANINGATVIGATFSNPSGTAVDQTVNGTFKDCVFEGVNGLRWCKAGETVVFENCVFSGSTYGAHFDDGANDVLFKNCTFSGFNTFGAALTQLTFDGCTFKPNGKSGYNGANLWGSTKMINTEFIFDGTTTYEWVDCISSDKTYEFEGCTINGGSALNPDYISSRTTGTKIVFDGVEYIYKEGDYLASSTEAIVTNTSALKEAIKANEVSNINLISGEYEIDFYSIANRDELNIKGSNGTKVAFNNLQVRASQFNTLTIENCEIMRMPNKAWGHLVFGSSDKANGVYTISNCTFNGVGSQGIYINENVSGATYNILNCTFNGDFGGEGAVTIQNNDGVKHTVNVTGCTFNNIPATSHKIYIGYPYKDWTLNTDLDAADIFWK